MAVETTGVVQLKGEDGPAIPVRVFADSGRLRLESANGVVGDWSIHEIGLNVLAEGFTIRAEGEELFLKADDDVGVAEELGVAAASPRMARKLAARHNPDRPLPEEPEEVAPSSNMPAIGLAIAGALVILGGVLIDSTSGSEPTLSLGPLPFWMAFLVGGLVMVGLAYLMSAGREWARTVALLVTSLVVLCFALMVTRGVPDSVTLIAYGFVAGGMVVGIAVLVAGEPSG
jgi:hypothetical protein